jgi:hypothetical protein
VQRRLGHTVLRGSRGMAPKGGKPRPSVTIKPHKGLECKVPPASVPGASSAATASFFRKVNESMSDPEAAQA